MLITWPFVKYNLPFLNSYVMDYSYEIIFTSAVDVASYGNNIFTHLS